MSAAVDERVDADAVTWKQHQGVWRAVPDPTQAAPSSFNPDLIACYCGATLTQTCRSSGGHPCADHSCRLVSRRCPCGELLAPRKLYCEPCRVDARARSYKVREIRKPTRVRRVA